MTQKDPQQALEQFNEAHIAAVLEQRFGHALCIMPRQNPAKLLIQAQQCGFVDAEGYLTRKGRALLARYH